MPDGRLWGLEDFLTNLQVLPHVVDTHELNLTRVEANHVLGYDEVLSNQQGDMRRSQDVSAYHGSLHRGLDSQVSTDHIRRLHLRYTHCPPLLPTAQSGC